MPAGRPTKYKPEYCEEVVKFFTREIYQPMMVYDEKLEKEVAAVNKFGAPIMIPCELPTKEGFAISIGVDRDTVKEWAKVHPEFSAAIKKAEDLQKNILIQNGLLGNYEKTFAIFVAKNVTDMADKVTTDHTSSDGSMTPKSAIDASKLSSETLAEIMNANQSNLR